MQDNHWAGLPCGFLGSSLCAQVQNASWTSKVPLEQESSSLSVSRNEQTRHGRLGDVSLPRRLEALNGHQPLNTCKKHVRRQQCACLLQASPVCREAATGHGGRCIRPRTQDGSDRLWQPRSARNRRSSSESWTAGIRRRKNDSTIFMPLELPACCTQHCNSIVAVGGTRTCF